jgi:mannose-6-phosphate isomerase-like protein (cupin superfamily)
VKKPQKEKLVSRNTSKVAKEDAHGGSGKRRMIFCNSDAPKSRLEAVSVGYLPRGGTFDWHRHDGIDEIISIVRGKATVKSGGKTFQAKAGDFLLVPSRTMHKITNTGPIKLRALFVRFRR